MAEYIDREAALDCFACDLGKKDYSVSYQGFMTEAAFRINNLPAADVRPVVRGRWIDHYEPYSTGEEWIEAQYGYECSICGRWEYEKEPFCNCGAKMEES